MQLVPYIGEQRVRHDSFSIVVDPEDQKRVNALVERASKYTVVTADNFPIVSQLAGQLKSMLNEILDAKKAAKRPFAAVEQTLETKAQEVSAGLQRENSRILKLLSAHVEKLEAAEREAARAREEQMRADKARLAKELQEAKEAKRMAEERARMAQDEKERLEARLKAEQAKHAAFEAELEAALAREDFSEPTQAKVPGGRVDHPYEFKLIDPKLVIQNYPRLLKIELDILACRDVVRSLKELNPNQEPEIAGIQITQKTSVSVRASA
jgi:DNA repair exonuclease SbcCD ATPase subunit